MKRKDEFDAAKKLLNEVVNSNNHELYARSREDIVRDLIEVQKKDVNFIKTMLFSSRFYDCEGKLIRNMRAVDFLTEDIRAFQLIPYMELVEKMKSFSGYFNLVEDVKKHLC